MCFSRRVRLLLIVIAAGVSVSAETRKPIYRIRRYCKAMSEYSPICSIGLTLVNAPTHKRVHPSVCRCTYASSCHSPRFPRASPFAGQVLSSHGLMWQSRFNCHSSSVIASMVACILCEHLPMHSRLQPHHMLCQRCSSSSGSPLSN